MNNLRLRNAVKLATEFNYMDLLLDGKEKTHLEKLRNTFYKSIKDLIDELDNTPVKNYLEFSANIDSYTKEEKITISQELLKDLQNDMN